MAERPDPRRAGAYPLLLDAQTRWADNDLFGHLNNAVYYELFDSAINRHLATATGLAPGALPALGVVAESSCRFLADASFPDDLRVGLLVERLGRSSITYGLGLFRAGADAALAEGRWVHVYVDPATRRPVAIPEVVRAAVEPLALA